MAESRKERWEGSLVMLEDRHALFVRAEHAAGLALDPLPAGYAPTLTPQAAAATDAVACSRAILDAFGDSDDDGRPRGAIGLATGRLLLIGGHDFWGECVNLSSRLGEDLADPGEILLTASAAALIEARLQSMQPESHILALSGLKLAYWRVNA